MIINIFKLHADSDTAFMICDRGVSGLCVVNCILNVSLIVVIVQGIKSCMMYQRCWVTSLLMVFETRPSVFRASSKNYRECSAKSQNTRPLAVISCNTIDIGFEWLVKPFAFLWTISEHRLSAEMHFFQGLLMGRAASGSWGKIRWMWSSMLRPRIADTNFNVTFQLLDFCPSHELFISCHDIRCGSL
jgi:hypothetical protein